MPDPEDLTNIKAEFERKLKGLETKLATNQQELADLVQKGIDNISQNIVPTPAPKHADTEDTDIPDPMEDPKKYADYLSKTVTDSVTKSNQKDQNRQSKLAKIYADYPELQNEDPENEFYKEVSRRVNQLPEKHQSAIEDLELAVLRTASQFGIKPVAKRQKKDNEDFTLGNRHGGSNNVNKGKGRDKHDPISLLWIEALGMDPNDEKVLEKLEKASERKTWSKYSGSRDFERKAVK